jgi:two-component system phosphate regulon sensor histidine kinase PhoR
MDLFAGLMVVLGSAACGWVVTWKIMQTRVAKALESESTLRTSGIGGKVSRALGTLREQCEAAQREGLMVRRLADDRAAQSQRILAALVDPIVVFDEFGEVVEANAAAGERALIDLDGKPTLGAFFDDVVLAENVRDAARGATAGETRRFEYAAEDTAWDVLVRRIDANNRCLVVLHDVTRDREVAQLKSEFVAKASHELRTPLSSIRAYVEMLTDGEVDGEEQQKEFLRIVHEETARLARLVDNMLDISRIEAGVAQPHRSDVDLGAVAGRIVETMRPQAEERSIDLVLRSKANALCVEGDEDMLGEVLENLVSNAVKYTPKGGRVVVSLDPDDLTSSIVTTVTDTGLGIPPDDLELLFEKFYRISRHEREVRGTGLGLNLCRNIVEEVHHGRIGVDSTLGMGSRFWFSVPVKYSGASSTAA